MSADPSGPIARREVAYRLFAAEYDDADLEYSESDEERAPNYVVTPTGARVNRLFVVGVLTEVEPVGDDVLRARVVDPTGAFVVYAGQYQPDAVAFLDAADVPSFVAVTGKARTFTPEGSARVFTSVRPESVTTVDAATRDRWTVQAAEHTLARVATVAGALDRAERGDELSAALESAGIDRGLAAGVALALDHYGTTRGYLSAVRELALGAAAVVSGDRDAVPSLDLAPGDDGPVATDLAVSPAVGRTSLGAVDAPAPASSEGASEQASEPADATAGDDRPDPAAAESTSAADAGSMSDGPADGDPAPPEDELGDFEVADTSPAGSATTAPETADEPYDLDEAEREAVESEYGTEFSTGGEVGEPGTAGIEPTADPPIDPSAGSVDAEGPDTAVDATDESPASDSADDAPAAGVDLEDAAVEQMADLDDGDGADRSAVVAAVVDASGADVDAVEAAIDDALMSGRCYEPSDGRLKSI